jgi:hypothetical protein
MTKAIGLIKRFSEADYKSEGLKDVKDMLSHYRDADLVIKSLQNALDQATLECKEYLIIRAHKLSEEKDETKLRKSIRILSGIFSTLVELLPADVFKRDCVSKYERTRQAFVAKQASKYDAEEKL